MPIRRQSVSSGVSLLSSARFAVSWSFSAKELEQQRKGAAVRFQLAVSTGRIQQQSTSLNHMISILKNLLADVPWEYCQVLDSSADETVTSILLLSGMLGPPWVGLRSHTETHRPSLTATLVADVWLSARLSLSLSDGLDAARLRGWKVEFHFPTRRCPPRTSLPCPSARFAWQAPRVFLPLRHCSQQNERRGCL